MIEPDFRRLRGIGSKQHVSGIGSGLCCFLWKELEVNCRSRWDWTGEEGFNEEGAAECFEGDSSCHCPEVVKSGKA